MIEKGRIGHILKNRIKEMGYTQEDFAEAIGESNETLKKYYSGKNAYDYEKLLKFAKQLECSTDYLLGLTDTPDKELQAVKDKTGLSDKAIRLLQESYMGTLDDYANCRWILDTIDTIISDNKLLSHLMLYLCSESREIIRENRLISDMMRYAEDSIENEIGTDDVILTGITKALIECKNRATHN